MVIGGPALVGVAVALPLALAGDVIVLRATRPALRDGAAGDRQSLNALSFLVPAFLRTILAVTALFISYVVSHAAAAVVGALAAVLAVRGAFLLATLARGRGRR